MPDMWCSVGITASPPGLMTLPLTSQQVFGWTCYRSAVRKRRGWLCDAPTNTLPDNGPDTDLEMKVLDHHHIIAKVSHFYTHGEGVNMK